ncbi:MAG: tetratricopeptide repeat protein [Alphaproteobacteria bacterium]|nr:tetratricopeptide repeat protein [Alphaproteobacteria bacterium]
MIWAGRVGRAVLWAAAASVALALGACGSLELARSNGSLDPAESSGTLAGNLLVARVAGGDRDARVAAARYGHALAEDPTNERLRERAFLFSLAAGDVNAAGAYAEELIGDSGDAALPFVVKGVQEARAGRFDASLKAFEAAAGGGSSFTSLMLAAWASAGAGDAPSAKRRLEEALGRNENQLFLQYHRALIADFAGDTETAGAAYGEALKIDTRQNPRLMVAAASYYQRANRVADAKALLASGASDLSEDPAVSAAREALAAGKPIHRPVATAQQGLAETFYGLAGALAGTRGIDLPIVYLQLALALQPDFDIGSVLLGELFENAGRPDEALAAYARVRSSSPYHANTAIERARLLDDQDRTDEAIAALRQLDEPLSVRFRANVATGDILRSRERWAEAADAYGAAIALISEPTQRDWAVYYAQGIVLERAGKWDEALARLRTALELYPDQPLVLNYIGYTWIERGERLDEALAMIEKAVEQRPTDGHIIDSLGWAHFQLGNYELAVKYLEEAVLLQPGDPLINDHLGDAYWRVGRTREAGFQWRHALAFEPDADLVPLIEAKIAHGLEAKGESPASVARSE